MILTNMKFLHWYINRYPGKTRRNSLVIQRTWLMDPKLRLTNVLNIPIKVETISDMVNPEENWGVLEFMI